ncbi:Uracil-DNA glycosylase [Candidatus Lokiarchaeum ossiferum]|uniref:Uracil-DNA glycosylase n=1 Tax=Candidatus Lokiarchaeum ossiferum TaxID=2951803 RepID=A0ABY6HTI9_9ARCH|nr:Uracil-DNA glycosylase [Candidatus Lokiarchaeum sp. B-35]
MNDWLEALPFFKTEQYSQLDQFVRSERSQGKSILPAEEDVFNALKFTPLEQVKVVILGQDPYPNKRHAHGLSFSIPETTPDIPKSLKNIFKELESDVGVKKTTGSLIGWAKQGVMLLNTVLTVEEGLSNSHKSKGWEKLTKEIITTISSQRDHVVFILWGGKAQKMKKWIATEKHLILESPHPSPLSSYRGFFGSHPFSQVNEYLSKNKRKPIDWSL